MKKKIILCLIAVVLLFSVIFSGCQSSGVAQADYDQVKSQLTDAQSQLTQAQTAISGLNSQVDADKVAIKAKDDKIAYYESQIADLKDQYNLTGATPAETAAKIVSYYHDTHVYSSYDLFVCSDMAAEVWNMLKAAGVSSVVVVGDKDNPITDILQSNHAWVLAEVGAGQYLALETTGGFTVTASQNPLYYRGWSFASPADLKSYNDLVKEYNTRVGFRNNLNDEANNTSDPAVFDKLTALRLEQENTLNTIKAKINSLASVLQ